MFFSIAKEMQQYGYVLSTIAVFAVAAVFKYCLVTYWPIKVNLYRVLIQNVSKYFLLFND